MSHISVFRKEIRKASKKSDAGFFNWFNNSKGDVDYNFKIGERDFDNHIMKPVFGNFWRMINFSDKNILEIGYGGGRLLSAACNEFNTAFGIDVHKESEKVRNELVKHGNENFVLVSTDGKNIPFIDCHFNFIYSFIVLQHVEKIIYFKRYIRETYRVLKEGGIAIIYFGRMFDFSNRKSSKIVFYIDKLLEKICFYKYMEFDVPVNQVNLRISLKYAKEIARREGFIIKSSGVSMMNGYYGGQYYMVLVK